MSFQHCINNLFLYSFTSPTYVVLITNYTCIQCVIYICILHLYLIYICNCYNNNLALLFNVLAYLILQKKKNLWTKHAVTLAFIFIYVVTFTGIRISWYSFELSSTVHSFQPRGVPSVFLVRSITAMSFLSLLFFFKI